MSNGTESVDPILTKLVGVISFAVSCALFVFLAWFLYRIFSLNRPPTTGVYVLIGITLPLAFLFANIGVRFVFNLPNTNGSILSPVGWSLLGLIFILFGFFATYTYINSGKNLNAEGLISVFMLGFGCVYLAFKSKNKSNEK